MLEQHHENVVVHNHAGRLFISELWVERKAEVGEKVDGSCQVHNGQIHKEGFTHEETLALHSLFCTHSQQDEKERGNKKRPPLWAVFFFGGRWGV